MTRSVRSVLARSETRWTVVVVVLAIAGIVALWPPGSTSRAGGSAAGPVPQELADRPRTAPPPDDAELADRRARAALQPCPAPVVGVPGAGPLAGQTVPCLGAPGTVDLAAGLVGRQALLNVWASWCGPCRQEIPVLARYAAQPGSIAVIGINVRDRPADALDVLIALGAHYPSVTDPDAALLAALRSPPVLPTTYILRPDGSVALVTPPRVFGTPQEITDTVRRYLQVPP